MDRMTQPKQTPEKRQGTLTIFASYFPGAGKSYAMLQAAKAAQAAGTDVVIGVSSSARWPETALPENSTILVLGTQRDLQKCFHI